MRIFFLLGCIAFSFSFVLTSCNCKTHDGQITEAIIAEETIPDAMSVIFSRKSVRQYTEEKISNDQLELLVKAGMAAPTARNLQPWTFLIITEEVLLKEMADMLPFGKMLSQAAAAIIVCGDLSKVDVSGPEYWVQDCSAATQNILLATEALGLGGVWIGAYPSMERANSLKTFYNLPEHIMPLSVISLGYPKGEHVPKDKWDANKVFWNKWE